MHVFRILYWLWYLTAQIVIGSFKVVGLATTGRSRTAIVAYPTRAATDLELTLFTSAITITPGTLVVGVAAATESEGTVVFVHSLFDNDRSSILAGLTELEGHLLRALRNQPVEAT